MTRNTLTTTADIFDGVPVSDTKSRRVGFWIVFVTFGLFGTWAAFAPLDSAAYSPGVVPYRAIVRRFSIWKAVSSKMCSPMMAIWLRKAIH